MAVHEILAREGVHSRRRGLLRLPVAALPEWNILARLDLHLHGHAVRPRRRKVRDLEREGRDENGRDHEWLLSGECGTGVTGALT